MCPYKSSSYLYTPHHTTHTSLLSQGDQAAAAPKGGIDVGSPNGEKEAKEKAKQAQEDAYKSKITAATVINLATTDVERFQPVGVHSHYLFLCPLEIAAITWCVRGVRSRLGLLRLAGSIHRLHPFPFPVR